MKEGLADLLPSRAYAKRMLELETELKHARAWRRRHSKSPDTLARWGLDQPAEAQQEEGWFLTYLDMMTLLLVVMIVMLAFSGGLSRYGHDEPVEHASQLDQAPATRAGANDAPVAEENVDTATEASPAPAAQTPGTGLLPAGSGLLPDTIAVGETLPGWRASWELESPFKHPADAGPLPRDALVHSAPATPPVLPTPSRSLDEMYPGFGASDLAASFVGPFRPPSSTTAIAADADSAPAQVQETIVVLPPAEPALSEGELVAAGLSLGDLGSDVEVVISERSVNFRVNSEILFDSSQADLSRSGLGVLRRIVKVLAGTNHEITVEGHTDSVPVGRNLRYPSNWELSSARAGSVVRYLQANGIERNRLKAVGYADTRPIGNNNTPEGRAANRRVELVIEKRD